MAQYDECKDAATADELENLECVVETVVDASGLSGQNNFDPPVGFHMDKVVCVFPLFICPEFHVGQNSYGDHRKEATYSMLK